MDQYWVYKNGWSRVYRSNMKTDYCTSYTRILGFGSQWFQPIPSAIPTAASLLSSSKPGQPDQARKWRAFAIHCYLGHEPWWSWWRSRISTTPAFLKVIAWFATDSHGKNPTIHDSWYQPLQPCWIQLRGRWSPLLTYQKSPSHQMARAMFRVVNNPSCSGSVRRPYHLVMTNIAMENPQNKWRFLAGKIIYFD